MKRLFAIGTLLLLGYLTVGPMLGFWAEEWRENQQLSQGLNVYHSTDDLVEFAFPVPLHQYGQTRVDESLSGEFEYQGRYYNMVRQELRNDTLHLFCYQDSGELARREALNDFIQKTVGGDAKSHTQKGFSLKLGTSDYARRGSGHLIFVFEDCLSQSLPFYLVSISSPVISCPAPPPKPFA